MMRAATLVAILLGPTVALAQPARRTVAVAVAASDCARKIVEAEAIAAALRVELGATVELTAVAAATGDAGYRLVVDCAGADGLSLAASRGVPERTVRATVSLEDALPAVRARTFAIAVAEQLRSLDTRAAAPTAPTPPALPIAVAPKPPETAPTAGPIAATTPTREPRRMQLARGSTIALATFTGVSLILGASLTGAANSGPSGQSALAEVNTAGITLMSLSALSIAAGGVTLWLWLRERGRPPARVSDGRSRSRAGVALRQVLTPTP